MLIKCRECGKEYSDKAESCVNCGCPTVEKDELTRSFENSDGGVAVGGAYLVGMGIKNLPNMKWWQRVIFYTLFGGVLFVVFAFIFALTDIDNYLLDNFTKTIGNLIFILMLLFFVILPIIYLEFKTQKKMKAKKIQPNKTKKL